MALSRIAVMYGHLEGTGGKFARDPSGYLAIDAGVFRKHGLDVSWEHVQGTEERYHRLERGSAQISLVVGRASLQHFLRSGNTRILGCAMNSCPYDLLAQSSVRTYADLRGKTVACRAGPARNAPVAEMLARKAQLESARNVELFLPPSDLDAFTALADGRVEAALLPRPYGFLAEEKGFARMADWPGIVDDPLPITLETTATLLSRLPKELHAFLAAHREGIALLKSERVRAMEMLQTRFGHSPRLAARTCDDYFVWLNERLTVDEEKFRQLLSQLAPERLSGAPALASAWVMPGALVEARGGIH